MVLALFHNYYYYVIVILFTQVLTNILTAVLANKMYPKYQAKGKMKEEIIDDINKRIKALFTAKLGGVIVNSADTIVISAFLGLTALAVYQNYYYIMTAVVGLLGIILNACTAGIGNSLITESEEKNYNDFKKLSFMYTWIVSICVCCFLCLFQPFMELWVGKDLLLSFPCVIMFCIYFYLYTINHFWCMYKDSAGMWYEDRFRPLTGAMINLILNILLVKKMGMYAILLSTILSYLMVAMPWLLHNLFSLVFKCSYVEYLKKQFIHAIITVIIAVICYFISMSIKIDGFINLVIRLIICMIIPNMIFIISYRQKKEFDEMLDLINKITKNKSKKICDLLIRKGDKNV